MANQKPVVTGQTSVTFNTNQTFNFTSLISASDPDGSVASYSFFDSTPGAGFLTLDGAHISGTSVTVLASQLSRVGYSTGSTAGSNQIDIQATDNLGLASNDFFMTINVNAPANQKPVISGQSSVTFNTNQTFNFTSLISASDPDGSVASYSFFDSTPGAGFLTLDGAHISGTSVTVLASQLSRVGYSTGSTAGSNQLDIQATDNLGLASNDFFMTINVNAPANQKPVVSGQSSVTFNTNQTFNFTSLISASDPDGSVASYSFFDSTPGAGFLTLDGAHISGTSVTVLASQLSRVGYSTGSTAGSNQLDIQATDNLGLASNDFFMTINVNAAGVNQKPVVSGQSSVTFNTNQTFNFTSLISASDPDGSVASYSFFDSTPGAGFLTLDGAHISGTSVTVLASQLSRVGYSTGSTAGSNQLDIQATDNLGLASNDFFMTINVNAAGVNQKPVVSGQSSVTFNTNQTFNFTSLISASDPDGSVASYSFFDSTPGAGFLTLDGAHISGTSVTVLASQLSRVGYSTGSTAGSNQLDIQATDNLGLASNDFFMTINVNAAGVNQKPVVSGQSSVTFNTNQTFNFTSLISASDPDGSVASYSFFDSTPGAGFLTLDGAHISGTSVTVLASQLSRVGYSTGSTAGSNQLDIQATDNLGLASNDFFMTINVSAAGANQAPVVNGPSSVSFPTNVVVGASQLYANATDADGSVATIRYWDSTPGAGHFTLDGVQITSGFVDIAPSQISRVAYVTGPSAGSNDIVVEAFDNQGLVSNDLPVHINVLAVSGNQAPTVTGPANLSFSTNQTIGASQMFASATDPDGSVATIQFWDSTPGAGHFTLGGAQITRSHVDVSPSQLSQVSYVTGPIAGTNDIVIDAIDNQGNISNDLTVHLSIGGGGNQAPVLSGPTQLIVNTNSLLSSAQLITSAHDPDGSIDHYTFYDSTPGDGFLTLDSSQIAGTSISVAASDLNRVGYRAGTTNGGTNEIAIQVFDAANRASNTLQVDIDVANPGTSGPSHELLPVDASTLSPSQQQQIAEFQSVTDDLGSSLVDALGQLSADWIPVAQFVDANPQRVKELLSQNSTDVFFNPTRASDLDEGLGTSIDALVAIKNGLDDVAQGHSIGHGAAVAANDFVISYASGVVGGYAAGAITATAVAGSDGILLPLAPLIYATSDIAVSYGVGWLLHEAEDIVAQSWLDPSTPPWSYDPTTGAFVSLQIADPAAWQRTAVRLSLDTGSPPTSLTLVGDAGGVAEDDFLVGARGDDHISGGAGDDIIFGLAGNDTLDGGPGIDTAVYGSALNAYTLTSYGGTIAVLTSGNDGHDRLSNFEKLQFSDQAIDVAAVGAFDALEYIASNPDLIKAFGPNGQAGFDHYVTPGFTEGRQINSFDALEYLASNTDLIQGYGLNLTAAEQHYVSAGFNEGRATHSFDALEYLASNTDLIHGYGLNLTAAEQHYVGFGFKESRQTHSFDALEYLASNTDLIQGYGLNLAAAEQHYVSAGFNEGRATHSFDALEYLASNTDLIQGYGLNLTAAEQHYVSAGFKEGRATHSFDALEYLASNTDLIQGYGPNLTAAEQHYVGFGFKEGRATHSFDALEYLASNTDLIQGYGLNLTAAEQHYVSAGFNEGRATRSFDALEYLASNTDLIQGYGLNLTAAEQHYVSAGFNEGRATHSFDPEAYLSRNPDLLAAYGHDDHAATVHWITHGFFEGREWMT